MGNIIPFSAGIYKLPQQAATKEFTLRKLLLSYIIIKRVHAPGGFYCYEQKKSPGLSILKSGDLHKGRINQRRGFLDNYQFYRNTPVYTFI